MGPAWEHTSEADLVAIRDSAPAWPGVQRLDNTELAILLRGAGTDTSPEQQVRFTAASSAHPGLTAAAVEAEAAERFQWASSWLHAVDEIGQAPALGRVEVPYRCALARPTGLEREAVMQRVRSAVVERAEAITAPRQRTIYLAAPLPTAVRKGEPHRG